MLSLGLEVPELPQFVPLLPESRAVGPELCLVVPQAKVETDRLWGLGNYVLG